AVLDDDVGMHGRAMSGVQILGAPHELDTIVAEFSIHGIIADRVVVAGESDSLGPAVLQEIERVCQKRQIELSFLPRMIGVTEWTASPIERNATLVPEMPRLVAPSFFRLKRTIDIFGSLILLVILSPLLLFGSLLVLMDVGLPILFWQERLGWKR